MTSSSIDVKRVATTLASMIRKVDRADPFGVAVDSAAVGRRQLERHFKSLGTTPHKELSRIRAEFAAGELADKDGFRRSVKGIARRLGYQNERRLREATAKAFGLSPREIRRGSRIDRSLKLDEEIRRKARGSRIPAGLWSNYRRRKNREILLGILRKATPLGAKVIVDEVSFPRLAQGRKIAAELAMARAIQLSEALPRNRSRAA